MSNKPQIDPKLFSEDASNVLLQNIIAQSANEEETVEAQPAKADADKPNFFLTRAWRRSGCRSPNTSLFKTVDNRTKKAMKKTVG